MTSFLQPGEIVSELYQIESLLGQGGMAQVYRCTDVSNGSAIALKLLVPPDNGEHPAVFRSRFQREAEALAALNHPNIVRLYDYGDAQGRPFLAMELIDGPRLADIFRAGPLTIPRTVAFIAQVCDAIGYAHSLGMVHRDLKANNLMVTRATRDSQPSERIKVVDFGLVKFAAVSSDLTQNGIAVGSPQCMAPEQIRSDAITPETDIYAVGVLLFRALTGKYPFQGRHPAATLISHLRDTPPFFANIAQELEIPTRLEFTVRKCLAKEPAERFHSAAALREALSPFLKP